MNYIEINKIFNNMLDNTRIISIETQLYFLIDGLIIDKKSH